jgi:hypothetical protein
MKKIILIGSLIVCSCSFAQTKNDKIKELLVLTGSGNMGEQFAKQFITQFKNAYPSVPEKVWSDFSKEIKASDLDDLVIPIYAKYYTDKDIDDLITFYKTPIRTKNNKESPVDYAGKSRSRTKMGKGNCRKSNEKIRR